MVNDKLIIPNISDRKKRLMSDSDYFQKKVRNCRVHFNLSKNKLSYHT